MAKGKAKKIDIPSDMQDMVLEQREALVENVVESDDELLERYLEGEPLSDDEIKVALKKGILSRSFAPVLCGSATKNIGVDLLQDFTYIEHSGCIVDLVVEIELLHRCP